MLAFVLTMAIKTLQIDEDIQLEILTGFMGSYAKFSTFMYEGFNLFKNNKKLNAFVYILSFLIIGIIGFLIDIKIGLL